MSKMNLTAYDVVNNVAPDVVYVDATQAWHCCTYPPGGGLNCTNPSPEQFIAPAPDDLITIQFLPRIGTPTYITESSPSTATPSISTTISSASTAVSSSSDHSQRLSTGASVGMGVGVGVGGLTLLSLVGYLVYRSRLKERRHKGRYYSLESQIQLVKPQTSTLFPVYNQGQITELPQQPDPAELPTEVTK